MKQFFAQQNEICDRCECELPTGSVIFTDRDKILCEDCYKEKYE